MTVQLEYINHLLQFVKNILALCLMLSVTYYAQNNAGIIGWSLSKLYSYCDQNCIVYHAVYTTSIELVVNILTYVR